MREPQAREKTVEGDDEDTLRFPDSRQDQQGVIEPSSIRRGERLSLAPSEPKRFDKYQLLAALGQGGMAEVFLAVSTGPAGFSKL